MYGPQSGRKRAQLNAFHAAAFNERDRILEVVVSILRAVWREDAARRHGLAVDGFDDTHFVGADFDQRHFPHDLFKRILDEVQPGFQYVGLDTDLAFGCDDSPGRHLSAEVPPFFDCDFARADVNEDTLHDYQKDNQNYEGSEEHE